MSKIHIGEEVEKILAAAIEYQNTDPADSSDWLNKYSAFKDAVKPLAETLGVMDLWLIDFFYSFFAYKGINENITAEQLLKIIQIARPEVEA